MKKIVLIFAIMIGVFSITTMNVNAETFKSKNIDNDIRVIEPILDGEVEVSCDGILTQEGYEIVQEVLGWIRILAPAVAVLLIAIDLGGAVMSQDNDLVGKATKKIVPRLIGVVLLFFVPTIVRMILSIDGIKGKIVISDDPLCNTMITQVVDRNDYELVI